MYLIKTVLFVAQRQKASGLCSHYYHGLDCHPSLHDSDGKFIHRHYRWSLYTNGSLQQCRSGEDSGVCHILHWISSAVDSDDFLLLSHCPRSTYKGKQHRGIAIEYFTDIYHIWQFRFLTPLAYSVIAKRCLHLKFRYCHKIGTLNASNVSL